MSNIQLPDRNKLGKYVDKLKPIAMNLYKAHLVDIWFTNSARAVFRYPGFNFSFKRFCRF